LKNGSANGNPTNGNHRNNIAFACPICGAVYIMSHRIHGGERVALKKH
jgi:predicted RNA-binding Zn-ribbon protein involved in translation (DUF1610 family)